MWQLKQWIVTVIGIYVVVQFFPWFKFYFPLFKTRYHTLPYPKKGKIKFKPRKILNHIYTYHLNVIERDQIKMRDYKEKQVTPT